MKAKKFITAALEPPGSKRNPKTAKAFLKMTNNPYSLD